MSHRMNGKNRNDGRDEEQLTVGQVLRAMEGPECPPYIRSLVAQVQEWMITNTVQDGFLSEDELPGMGERRFQGDPESLLGKIDWVTSYADLLPPSEGIGQREAVVLALGPMDVDEGLRMAVDHAALFSQGRCKKVWLLCDNWIAGDVMRYQRHLLELARRGVEIRALLVTPWGWTEIPCSAAPGAKGYLPWQQEWKDGHA
ncbi:MAG: hypothetical protein K9L28_02550 [Synergistales bacterium]|nr:hypothetical protein [Synergistales bacterium]